VSFSTFPPPIFLPSPFPRPPFFPKPCPLWLYHAVGVPFLLLPYPPLRSCELLSIEHCPPSLFPIASDKPVPLFAILAHSKALFPAVFHLQSPKGGPEPSPFLFTVKEGTQFCTLSQSGCFTLLCPLQPIVVVMGRRLSLMFTSSYASYPPVYFPYRSTGSFPTESLPHDSFPRLPPMRRD